MSNPITELRNVVRERGWTQFSYEGDNGEVCMFGALNTIITGSPYRSPNNIASGATPEVIRRYLTIRKHLTRTLGGISLLIWNDAPGRTQEEVDAFLARAEESWTDA